jgi:2,4-dienoyl-CoA reductase-like NADH-dependent reductase (Old Yellow Enzyme family)
MESGRKFPGLNGDAVPARNALMAANPDLVARMRADAALNEADAATFYTPGPKGYTDYPALAATLAA